MTIDERIELLAPDDYHRFLGWFDITDSIAQRYRDEKPDVYEAMLYSYNLFFDPVKIAELHSRMGLPHICSSEKKEE